MSSKQKNNNIVWKLLTYFRRGFGNWLTFILSAIQFLIVTYELAIANVPILMLIFPTLYIFSVIFIGIFVPLCIAIGWLDYKKGSAPVENVVNIMANPWSMDISKALLLMCDDKKTEAKKVLEKWVK